MPPPPPLVQAQQPLTPPRTAFPVVLTLDPKLVGSDATVSMLFSGTTISLPTSPPVEPAGPPGTSSSDDGDGTSPVKDSPGKVPLSPAAVAASILEKLDLIERDGKIQRRAQSCISRLDGELLAMRYGSPDAVLSPSKLPFAGFLVLCQIRIMNFRRLAQGVHESLLSYLAAKPLDTRLLRYLESEVQYIPRDPYRDCLSDGR